MFKKMLMLWCALLPVLLSAQVRLQLKDFASGFTRPVDIAHCGDSRMFVVEQKGLIWVVDSTGKRSTVPFMDIDDRVINSGNERGLLGLAFHPNYKQNGWFFVNYIKNDGFTRIARFTVSATDPNKADPASELNILEQSQPFNNHKGGCTKFGPDGFLYLSLGDGGSGGDPQDNGQKRSTLLGKMLRIDVNNSSVTTPYKVPESNPFVNNSAFRPEIWSRGWRNVWRFSYERLTGDMW
jgi:glucose/arabinose dehydrogenase